MKIELHRIPIRELIEGYVDAAETRWLELSERG